MKFKESELIVNPDGSIYHLKLRPEDIATTILLVGDPARVGRISKYFDTVELQKENREFVTHTGIHQGRRLTVISTGIGTDNIDIVVNELDALANIDFKTRRVRHTTQVLNIIRVGTSGCLQPEIAAGEFVASSGGVGIDNLLHFYKKEYAGPLMAMEHALEHHFAGALPMPPYYFPADATLLHSLANGLSQGLTVTCPGFYGPQGRQLRATNRFTDFLDKMQTFEYEQQKIMNFEMETSAIFGLSYLLGHRALSFNVILANRNNQTFSSQPREAVERLIQEVLARLINVPS